MKSRANLLVGLTAAAAVLGLMFALLGYEHTWRWWGVAPMSPHFADLRVITGAAASVERGYDPMLSNPGDPWGRTLNYPRVWQGLYRLGVDDRHTTAIGLLLIAMYLAGLLLAFPRLDRTDAALVVAAVVSPASLLGIERGNIDLLMFFLLTSAVAAAGRRHVLATGLVLTAFILKLYPILGLAVMLRQSRRVLIASGVAALAVAVVYIAVTREDLMRISMATPRSTDLAYGMDVARMRYASLFPHLDAGARWAVWAGVAGAVVMALTAFWRRSGADSVADKTRLDAFRVGAAVYAGTFLLGANWDYRLIFLIFTIPQLRSWLRGTSRRAAAGIALVGIYLSMWYMLIVKIAGTSAFTVCYVVDESANWGVFAAMVYLLADSAPRWMRRPGARPADTNRTGVSASPTA